MTQHFVVIGNPINHSKSPEIHQTFAVQTDIDIRYQRQYCPDNEASFVAVVEAFFMAAAWALTSLCRLNKSPLVTVRRKEGYLNMPAWQAQSIRYS